MSKRIRHQRIKKMITEQKIGRQADIQLGLEAEGIRVTQTTLSRDLRELGLIKLYEDGQAYYALPEKEEETVFGQRLAQYAVKVERASFILVLHCEVGEAALMANIIDAEKPDHILGTLAGADTLLVICRDEAAAQQVEDEIGAYIDGGRG
ncbi:arginine repressor [Streptococcus suis]|uniref:arginine repressor n=1 Tax=Streptococcus suis TaxID=1307 RepID=UPI001ABE2702|nr:arginine repressor [Streptococcus suis]